MCSGKWTLWHWIITRRLTEATACVLSVAINSLQWIPRPIYVLYLYHIQGIAFIQMLRFHWIVWFNPIVKRLEWLLIIISIYSNHVVPSRYIGAWALCSPGLAGYNPSANLFASGFICHQLFKGHRAIWSGVFIGSIPNIEKGPKTLNRKRKRLIFCICFPRDVDDSIFHTLCINAASNLAYFHLLIISRRWSL